MAVHSISKGLDLPITGDPQQSISDGAQVARVAVVADDFVGMKPRMAVQVGDSVKRGQLLFEDRKSEGVRHTAPGAGKVVAINRGRYRVLQSVVIELSASELEGKPTAADFQTFDNYRQQPIQGQSRSEILGLLAESGLLASIRTRPYGRVPSATGEAPNSVFVTAADSNPHAPDPDVVIKGREVDFHAGLAAVAKLSAGKTYLCTRTGSSVSSGGVEGITTEEFSGPHPSGTVGWHIHTLDPVHREKVVWHLNYQDVISIGRLVASGRLDVERVVSIAGPRVEKPRLLRTRMGAELAPLIARELIEEQGEENRVVSGSVLAGRTAMGDIEGFLGRYHLQISALREGRERELMGWMKPGVDVFSTSGAYVSSWLGKRKFALSTALNGGNRAQVPIGMYERVFPFDILPTFLLRALLSNDTGRAEELGALELDEEDLALCTFVCPNKHDYTAVLRKNLDKIWEEG